MSQEHNGDSSSHHRLFHAMVLMGGSIALGCGGASSSGTGDDESGGTGAMSGAGSAGTTAAGTGGTSAGNGGTGAGGSAGTLIVPTAGTASVNPVPTDCPPAQWNCNSEGQYCYGDTYALPESDCVCNDARPVAPSDCPAGTVFACHAATRTEDGRPLPQVVPFSCSCVTDTNNCDAECNEAAPSSGTCTDVNSSSGRSVLCNCAVVVLR
jgi:hypothetical protein